MFPGNNLGRLIARSQRVLRREFEARLALHDLTVPQVAVLMCLWQEDGKTISELSRSICTDGPTLTSLLDRMEAKDLISRERDTEDRRTVRIKLLEGGRSLQEEIEGAHEEVMGLVRRGMTESQIDQLRDLLILLCDTMEGAGQTG